jgi:prepilin-type N-terminal cleavage/methylation domain-containing protein
MTGSISHAHYSPLHRGRGYTLLELLVVLVIMGIVAGLVVPALHLPRAASSDLASVVALARQAAAQRDEVLTLRVSATGAWGLEEGSALSAHSIARGVMPAPHAGSFALILSPSGACAPEAATTRVATTLQLDALSCEIRDR